GDATPRRPIPLARVHAASRWARLRHMSRPAISMEFERALAAEIVSSEWIRVRVLAAALAIVLAADLLLFAVAPGFIAKIVHKPAAWWLPLRVIGPFLAYELAVVALLSYRRARGLDMPSAARFANAAVETSLPTYILWWINDYTGPALAFATWPSLLYFIFITASTLRLNFVLPMFTGAVAATGYLALAAAVLPLSNAATAPVLTPAYHLSKAFIMLLAGLVAGLVDRLLDRPTEIGGETRDICVMFLDIRNFTAHSRTHRPQEVVDFLNAAFAFMIEAIDRHHVIINKFLGDGFMAVFGAPLDDRDAVPNAVAAARDILAEIDRKVLAERPWPLRIGIGLHAGPAVTGTIGSPRRKE